MTNKKCMQIFYSGLGGHGSVAIGLFEAGFGSGSEQSAILLGIEAPLPEYLSRLDRLGVRHNYVARTTKYGYIEFLYKLCNTIRRLRPDVILAHGLASVPGLVIYKLMYPRTRIILRDAEANHLKRSVDWSLLRLAGMYVDAIVFLTPEARLEAGRRLKYTMARQYTIPNSVDLSRFVPSEEKNDPDLREKPIINIGMQSRLQLNKDHVSLLDAMKIIKSKYSNVKLYIAGDGATMNDLKERVRNYNLQTNVVFEGHLDQDQLLKFLSKLDIYVHATFGETMSIAIMQALSMGLPVVASNVGGVKNMINGSNGLLYSSKNSEELAEKVLRVIEDDNVRQMLRVGARTYACQNFGVSEQLGAYNKVILDMSRTV